MNETLAIKNETTAGILENYIVATEASDSGCDTVSEILSVPETSYG